jgi:hypothetical protein
MITTEERAVIVTKAIGFIKENGVDDVRAALLNKFNGDTSIVESIIDEAQGLDDLFAAGIAPVAEAADITEAEPEPVTRAEAGEPAPQIVQPDADGKFPTPLDGALFMAVLGIPQHPLRPRSKVALLPGFQKSATTDPTQIRKWANEHPNCNWGSLGREGEFFTFEADSTDVRQRFEATGNTFTSNLIVASRQGRGHRWYRSAPSVTNIQQAFTKHGDFSVRAKNMYCVSPGSIHPETGEQYCLASSGAPDFPSAAEIAFWESERIEKSESQKAEVPRDAQGLVPHGSIHGYMLSEAGKLRRQGLEQPEIYTALSALVHKFCASPIDESKVLAMSHSICNFPEGKPTPAIEFDGEASVPPAPARPTGRTLSFVRGSSIKPVRLKWLWRGRIIADKLNVFSGEPDVGKGMTTVDLAARITSHRDFPDCKNELDGPKDVIFLSSEDDMEDTIVPRLIVAGADMQRIHFAQISENTTGTVEEGIVCLDRDLPILEAKVRENPDIVLIIPDPVIAFLGDADPNKDKEVRPIYSKMKTFAKRLGVSFLFVNHWNKNQQATSINKTSGAKTMVSAPRCTWMFTKSPEDPTRYLMMKGKGNLSKAGAGGTKTLAYRIESVPFDFGDDRPVDPEGQPKLIWDGETDHTCDEVLQDAADPKERRSSKAEEFLTEFLAEGAKKAVDVYRAGDKAGLTSDKLKRARYQLDYLCEQIERKWYWAKSGEDIMAAKAWIYSPTYLDLETPEDASGDNSPTKAKAFEMFRRGLTIEEVVVQLGAPEGTVRGWRTRWGKYGSE